MTFILGGVNAKDDAGRSDGGGGGGRGGDGVVRVDGDGVAAVAGQGSSRFSCHSQRRYCRRPGAQNIL